MIKRFLTCTTRIQSKYKVDGDGLPLSPTWSVNSLLNTSNDQTSISDEQLDHLCRLAQLLPPKQAKDREQLKSDMNDLTRFVQSIQQQDFGKTEPLSHIWQETTGMNLRTDNVINTDKVNGTKLLEKAKQISYPFYTVKGQYQAE
ncbi:uncharacterized protein BX664DRAFT_361539 [Halteromyces radiatus]|uniref:uncharacterized protein n=1 Tax=Halteromyces radiatus TaxID=101107 RepID=UPI0022200785|nr:uncharacterized protein BX664DRAFT_361539 [Halteromyces radiatus]KAI8081368.1 hypothetical protein BX664DRAFT_361539 [Halteromyces radiatus]